MPAKLEIEKRERCKESFRFYIRQSWPVIEPGTRLVWNWHIDAIAEHLQAVYEGQLTRLVVNIAPGHMKSTIFSVQWPSWCWLKDPTIRWLCASHSFDLALRDNRNCRSLIESQWYQSNFGDLFHLAGDQNMKSYFENDRRGYRVALSVRGKGTGKRGSHLLIDDPNNAEDRDTELKATKEWFGSTWLSRLNDLEHGVMVVVGQRLRQNDLTGHILELGGWTHMCLPTEYEPARKCVTIFKDGRVWQDKRTQAGELLWPEKFPVLELEKLKRGLGSLRYAAQYQQLPVPAEGGMFKSHWLQYFEQHDGYYLLEREQKEYRILECDGTKFITVDLAISEKQHADFTVFAVWCLTPDASLLLLDVFRDRIDNPTQQRTLHALYQRYQPAYIVVESVAYQLSFVQQLRSAGLPVKEFKPVKEKVARAITASVMYEGGKVYHLKQASWLVDFEQELLQFPKAAHDDCVDVVSMACEQIASGFESAGGMLIVPMTEEEADTSLFW